MTNMQNFDDWLRKFKGSRRGKYALGELHKYFPPNKEIERDRFFRTTLSNIVLDACYGAAMFEPNRDPSKKRRLSDAKALEQLGRQRKALSEVRNFATTYRKVSGIAFGQTVMDLRSEGIGISTIDGTRRDVADILVRILDTYSSRLVRPIPLVAAGPLLSRNVYGCLHYDLPLDEGRHNHLPDVETMLLFDLVHTFRLRSKGICVRGTGQPMPAQGRPHYAVAAAFVSATFSNKVKMKAATASARLKNFLKQNPNVGFYPWPVFVNH